MPKSGTRRRRARDCWGSDVLLERVPIAWNHYPLVLAKAGTQITNREQVTLDSRLRGNERKRCVDSNGICFSAAKRSLYRMPAAMNFSRLIGSLLRAGSRGLIPAKRLASTHHFRLARIC